MDLDLGTLTRVAYLLPIAITLRKVFAPRFDLTDPMTEALARIDTHPRIRRRPPT